MLLLVGNNSNILKFRYCIATLQSSFVRIHLLLPIIFLAVKEAYFSSLVFRQLYIALKMQALFFF